MAPCVLTAEFTHETNTFNVIKTDYEAFRSSRILEGDDAISARGDANTELAGFLDVARKYQWDLVHAISADAEPAGPVTRDAFDRITHKILAKAAALGDKLDGILLGLHGAMVTVFSSDGEGEVLERLRRVLKRRIPIAVTLDPHANVTATMCENADVLISFKTYPHVDIRETARHAAELLHKAIQGSIRPKTLLVRRPMLEEANAGRTDIGPMIDWIEEAREHERSAGALAVSINGAFPGADVKEVGPTVVVTYDGEPDRHIAFAERIADKIWDNRENVLNKFYTPKESAEIARCYMGERPLIIADYADNPGAGAYGDATALLDALLKARVQNACFGPVVDAGTVNQLSNAKIGDTVSVSLGGKMDPRFGGPPLQVEAKLLRLSDGKLVGTGPQLGGLQFSFGPTAVILVGGVKVLVVTERSQLLDQEQFRAFGIEPTAHDVIVVKSQQHFRADFESIAGEIIICDCGALSTMDYAKMPFRNVPRPIYPLDKF
ncbi:M81 family metallopeptidase [Mesorhizobium sp. CO1-1-9]|uniref:M81 family metallopeptidase n=1 Tax=Mesorhizobium sp. CO1-1-9 TaxID=2876630 RepID=UPI001CCE7485|nr:M81 family metallopeptidase [Mesorhizobium sp. CO1-1-9]MBZ9699080.1 M81 family metallopeptidase [Mesorhizobium sp. CO1-1-9]